MSPGEEETMLEDHFVVPAAAQRLRACVLGAHLDEHYSLLVELDYTPSTIRHKLWVLSSLARWMTERGLDVADLDEGRVEEFLDVHRRRGRSCRGFASTALLLLERSGPRASSQRPSPRTTTRRRSQW
jgi:hypothetical protein